MKPAKGEVRKHIRELLRDGGVHTISEIYAKIGFLIQPESAYRYRERYLEVQYRYQPVPVQCRRPRTIAQIVEAGRNGMIYRCLQNMRDVERSGGRGEKCFRLKPIDKRRRPSKYAALAESLRSKAVADNSPEPK